MCLAGAYVMLFVFGSGVETFPVTWIEIFVTPPSRKTHRSGSRGPCILEKDVLRVEVSGPAQPHLTLVDLPGLYHAPDESQSVEGVDFVESLVLSYIRNKRSVILAVISAKSDIVLFGRYLDTFMGTFRDHGTDR